MKNRDVFGWLVVGVNWYTIIVIGGMVNLVVGVIVRIHDAALMLVRVKDAEKYHISASPKKLAISCVPLFLGLLINILTMFLVTPLLMGLQHLARKVSKDKDAAADAARSDFSDGKKWYDGLIYSAGVDPGLKAVRHIIRKQVPENSKVIDICCGTGNLAFTLSDQCEYVCGIDHSSKMIEFAKSEKESSTCTNVDFAHANAMHLPGYEDGEFDLAILALTLHEMPPSIRAAVLKEARRIARQIVILDYNVPAPMNILGLIALYFEFVAGYDHLKNYLHFRDKGGLEYLLEEVGLKRITGKLAHKQTLEFVKVQ